MVLSEETPICVFQSDLTVRPERREPLSVALHRMPDAEFEEYVKRGVPDSDRLVVFGEMYLRGRLTEAGVAKFVEEQRKDEKRRAEGAEMGPWRRRFPYLSDAEIDVLRGGGR